MPPDPMQPRSVTQTGSQWAVPTGVVSAETPLVVARPVPRPQPERPIRTIAHPEPVEPLGTGGAMVVAAHRPHSRTGEPLLLVDLAVATGRPAQDHPVAAGQRETPGPMGRPASGAGHAPAPGHGASIARSAPRTTQPTHPETAPIDIGHIVDMVHSRFVRKLAVEAERRAVR
jgi:hypothetical protein